VVPEPKAAKRKAEPEAKASMPKAEPKLGKRATRKRKVAPEAKPGAGLVRP
jgi:hypothetical protein